MSSKYLVLRDMVLEHLELDFLFENCIFKSCYKKRSCPYSFVKISANGWSDRGIYVLPLWSSMTETSAYRSKSKPGPENEFQISST